MNQNNGGFYALDGNTSGAVKHGEVQRRAGNMKYGDVTNDKEKTTKNLIMFHEACLFQLEATRCHN